MRSWPSRGTILVTAMFVVLVVHALLVVTLTALRTDNGQLLNSDASQRASLKAHSAALFALDQLSSSLGPTWEANHTVPPRAANAGPPARADVLDMSSADGDLKVLAWVEDSGDPTLRTVWGACYDGRQWHYSTAVAVRRFRNPGLLFGVKKGPLVDEFFFRPMDGPHNWDRAPAHPSINNSIFDCSAGRDGKLYVLQYDRRDPDGETGHHLKVTMLDSQAALTGQWSDLAPLPSEFVADPTGLAAGQDELYVSGLSTSTGTPSIMKLPLDSSGGGWSPLASLPSAVSVDSQGVKTLTTYPMQFTDLKAGPQGELYLQLQTAGTGSAIDTTFARYQSGNWEYFPKPEDLSGVSRRSYLPIEVDDVGNLLTFGLPNDTQPGQIYRFASSGVVSGGVIQGLWKALPTDPSLAHEDKLRQVTVDTQGHMVTGLGDPLSSSRPVQQARQVPLRADQTAQTIDLALPVADMNRVEAGGMGPSGSLEYVPVSWY